MTGTTSAIPILKPASEPPLLEEKKALTSYGEIRNTMQKNLESPKHTPIKLPFGPLLPHIKAAVEKKDIIPENNKKLTLSFAPPLYKQPMDARHASPIGWLLVTLSLLILELFFKKQSLKEKQEIWNYLREKGFKKEDITFLTQKMHGEGMVLKQIINNQQKCKAIADKLEANYLLTLTENKQKLDTTKLPILPASVGSLKKSNSVSSKSGDSSVVSNLDDQLVPPGRSPQEVANLYNNENFSALSSSPVVP